MNTSQFLATLGVNTHIDFPGYPPPTSVIRDVNYLGLKNLRDSAQKTTSGAMWRQVNIGTGARFCCYIPEGSPANMANALSLWQGLYTQGMIRFFEGPNEEDDDYAIQQGNSIATARAFHVNKIVPLCKMYLELCINMSFGSGWTADNNWHGNYDKVGDMSAYCDFGNAHTYPSVTQKTTAQIRVMNGLAQIAAPGRPVITTEIGWDENLGHTQADNAKKVLQAAFAGTLLGNPMTYFYALYDDGSGKFGLINPDGTPKPAGVAIKNLTTILGHPPVQMPTLPVPLILIMDTGGHTTQVTLDGLDGSHWIAIWNEVDPAHTVDIIIPSDKKAAVYRPLSSFSPTAEVATALMVSDEVVLVKVY